MKIERVISKLIKPYTPTPKNLKNYKLSFLDKHTGLFTFGVVLFYESKPANKRELEESLEKVLVDFYPLAGRWGMNEHMVDCSDQGAVYVEAEALDAELTMDLVVKNMETQTINHLVVDQIIQTDVLNPLLWIQVTHFPSGGLAIAIAVNHIVFDAFSLGVFIAAWSKATMSPDRKIEITPSFELPSLLPYKDHDFGLPYVDQVNDIDHGGNIIVKRLMFTKETITRLRSKLSPNHNGKRISRVRVVCAVIARALIDLDRLKHGETRDFMIPQPINMRGRTKTPLQHQQYACGNLVLQSLARRAAAPESHEMGLQEMVDLIGDSIEKCIADYAEILSPNQDGLDIIINTSQKIILQLLNPSTNIITFTDWSKFGFYQADFGFGKPIWTSYIPQRLNSNSIVLMSNKEGDGIEAWMYLNKNDMLILEQDGEIKLFST